MAETHTNDSYDSYPDLVDNITPPTLTGGCLLKHLINKLLCILNEGEPSFFNDQLQKLRQPNMIQASF